MKKTHIAYCITLITLFLTVSCLHPFKRQQTTMPPITFVHDGKEKPPYDFMNRLVDESEFIVEGKVLDSGTSFYGYLDGRKGIYTCGLFTVYKVFKGDIKSYQIEYCTEGGVVYDKETQSGAFSLCDDCNYGAANSGDIAILFLNSSNIVHPESKIKAKNRYNLNYAYSLNLLATNYKHLKGRLYDINYYLYEPIEQRVGKKPKVIKRYDYHEEEFKKKQKNNQQNSYKVDSLQPTIMINPNPTNHLIY